MKNHLFSVIITALLLDGTVTFSQRVKFNHIIDGKTKYFGPINAIAQDRLGYIWFGVGLAAGGHGGVYRYDGSNITALMHDQVNANSLKEATDLNALADEYLRLSYHGMRAKDKTLNVELQTHFDPSIGKVTVVPQDIGRALLNLYNNAFYAVNEKARLRSAAGARLPDGQGYEPRVVVTTRKAGDKIEITVGDNGNGIPEKLLDKIFQPFFTTKPAGQGTGLGLSLAYDIVTKEHRGELRVETKDGEGSEFIIQLPLD